MGVWNDREIRPDRPIQEALPVRLDHCGNAHDVDPVPLLSKDKIVCQKGNPQDMIEVGMTNEDILYFPLTFHVKGIRQSPRIK